MSNDLDYLYREQARLKDQYVNQVNDAKDSSYPRVHDELIQEANKSLLELIKVESMIEAAKAKGG